MTTPMRAAVVLSLLLASVAGSAAQPARLGNGTVTARQAPGSLRQALSPAPAGIVRWVGYQIATPPGDHWMCDRTDWSRQQPPATATTLEPATTAFVFLRLDERGVERVRVFSPGCAIDAGGLAVDWLDGVAMTDSVAVLSGLARTGSRRLADDALTALAMHAGAQAATAIIDMARDGATPALRGQALFWLSQRASAQAIGVIDEALTRDPDTDVKRRAVFALGQLPPDDGVPRLIAVARSHSNLAVRKQAMFWLGQSKDARALAFFQSILSK